MALAVVAALALSALDAGCEVCSTWPNAPAAFAQVLKADPQVLAVGEYHETTGAPKVPSALKRFTRELLPGLKGRITSLIVETWMLNGRCGEVEKQAAQAIEKTTERPASTEDEVTTLMSKSFAMGVKNHTLLITCADYRSMLDDAGELDPEASLLLVKSKVEAKAVEVREKDEGGLPGKLLVLYGGALHNDLVPLEAYAAFSFGPSLARETAGHYVELDLLVPEYVEADSDLLKEPWFRPALALARRGKTVLIAPHPNVYLLLFPSAAKK